MQVKGHRHYYCWSAKNALQHSSNGVVNCQYFCRSYKTRKVLWHSSAGLLFPFLWSLSSLTEDKKILCWWIRAYLTVFSLIFPIRFFFTALSYVRDTVLIRTAQSSINAATLIDPLGYPPPASPTWSHGLWNNAASTIVNGSLKQQTYIRAWAIVIQTQEER